MAAILPPIPGAPGSGGNMMRGTRLHQYNVPTPPAKPNNRQILKPIQKLQGKKEREAVAKRNELRSQQPLLTKAQTSEYRNSYKHNLCLDMLAEGYHKSYGELFALMKRQQDERLAAGRESLLWTLPQLEDQHEKLDMLKLHLSVAEKASRKDDYAAMYSARFELAKYFQTTGDKWLVDHFFNSCLTVSSQVQGDGGKMLAQGHCNVGLAMEQNGDIFGAVQHFEAYYKLASENPEWEGSDGVPLLTDACINMYRIYTAFGNKMEAEDPHQSLASFQKAYSMAKQSGERKSAGEAAYRLGLAYQRTGDNTTALQHLTSFFEVCKMTEDYEGVGRACNSIAESHKCEGDIAECIRYLQMFVEVSEEHQLEKAYSKACHNLGALYNTLGRYKEAAEYFSKAYNLSRAHNDPVSIGLNRVQFGIAMAHKMLAGFSSHIVTQNRTCLERLGEWKSSRMDQVANGLPETEQSEKDSVEVPPQTENSEENSKVQESKEEKPASEETATS